jgi:hypothetical protein
LADINEAIVAIQKLTSAKERYMGGADGYVVHETEVAEFKLKIESCDVLTYSQMEDAVEAERYREEEKKAQAIGGTDSNSLETARS